MVNYVGNWTVILRMKENGYFWITEGSADQWVNWLAGGALTTRPVTRAGGETSNTFAGPLTTLTILVVKIDINRYFFFLPLAFSDFVSPILNQKLKNKKNKFLDKK